LVISYFTAVYLKYPVETKTPLKTILFQKMNTEVFQLDLTNPTLEVLYYIGISYPNETLDNSSLSSLIYDFL
jgi:hypothetical protein